MEFQDFPLEVVSHIVSFLPSVKHINAFAQTCHIYHEFVREQDMRFVCREYGNLPGSTGKRGMFHCSPTGVLHGSCCIFFEGGATVSTYSRGVLSGFQMTVFEDGDIDCGMYKNGKRVGLWKNDSKRFRENWSGGSRRVYYNEDGSSYSHTKNGITEKIFCYDKNNAFLAMYKEEMLDQDFHCEKTNQVVPSRYVLHLPTEDGFHKTGRHFFHCCKKHQGDMPNDLLYFEKPDGFLV
uniref:F-box containing protein n=1 Tax=Marseillevirus sp. TaxID=2809551 RepID=A0AA96IXD7_9VIRU|nr:F-box containing protein [Marseillevirus sp.]